MPNSVYYFNHFARLPNLGLASLAGNIGDHHDVRIVDLVVKRKQYVHIIHHQLETFSPEMVGLSAMSFQSRVARVIAKYIKHHHPQIKIVVGGYHASMMPRRTAQQWGSTLDFLVRGEGEHTFRELCDVLQEYDPTTHPQIAESTYYTQLAHIPGLSYRQHSGSQTPEWVHNPDRPLAELSTIQLPQRESRILTRKFHIWGRKADVVETSRGCLNHCKYCSIHSMYGAHFRQYSVDRVLDDIAACKRQGAKAIFFADDNITLQPKHFIAICKGIIRRQLHDIHYTLQAHVGQLYAHPEMLKWALRANCKNFFLGIENPHPQQLKSLGKNVANMGQKAAAVIKKIHEHGAIAVGGFILGNPDDKGQHFANVLHYAQQTALDACIFFVLTPYPGTPIRSEMEQEGLIVNKTGFESYDALTAQMRTRHLSRSAVEILTEAVYEKFLTVRWLRETNIGKVNPWYFLKMILRLTPRAIKQKLLRLRGPRDYIQFLRTDFVQKKAAYRNLVFKRKTHQSLTFSSKRGAAKHDQPLEQDQNAVGLPTQPAHQVAKTQ